MKRLATWFTRGAEALSAALLVALFATFLIQILSRLVMQTPFGWTLELCLVLWVWLVFFTAGFVLKDRDHIRFDIAYRAAPDRLRRRLALLLAGPVYRALSWRGLYGVFVDSARASAAIGLVIAGALMLNYVVAVERIPQSLSQALAGADLPPLAFLVGVNLLILLLGAVLDATTLILVIVPLFLPTASALGIDLVHFGVLVVVNAMIGLITPPYGVLLFVTNAVTGIPLREIIREIWGFLAVLVLALAAMICLPGLVLWLPRLMGYPG